MRSQSQSASDGMKNHSIAGHLHMKQHRNEAHMNGLTYSTNRGMEIRGEGTKGHRRDKGAKGWEWMTPRDCGLIVFCNLLAEEEALNRIQPSAVLYTMPAHVQMKRYEQHAAVPTVLVGFEKAEIDLDYPPRPSLKVRNSEDAALAAEVMDTFLAHYSDTGLWLQLKGLRR
ncbi:unnamed protein product [Polarella glacialis]|uniref:Uncharacterized protein n=1 Tax=Polarella glacialis TaxID=89957 RepID=A0A813J5L8_POLGL|nr:unnamed protein product [Polarella glacialis]